MKNFILYSVLSVLILYFLFKPDKDYIPTQEEIQSESYVDKTQAVQDFPYPQISRTVKRLSHGKPIIPLNEDLVLPKGRNDINMIRTSDQVSVKPRMYLPDYYRKDRLSGNPTLTEELRPFVMNKDKSEKSWTDENISEHPKFYNADAKDELTNIGSFFDENNYYADRTSPDTESLVSDSCYKDKSGSTFCEDNTRLQLIPPKLISNPKTSKPLNTIGPYKNPNNLEDNKDRVMNGGFFYDNIKPSLRYNETFTSFDNNPSETYINH
jgi:hypothetical protein